MECVDYILNLRKVDVNSCIWDYTKNWIIEVSGSVDCFYMKTKSVGNKLDKWWEWYATTDWSNTLTSWNFRKGILN